MKKKVVKKVNTTHEVDKIDPTRVKELLQSADNILSGKKDGIILILEKTQHKDKSEYSGACRVNNVDRHHVVGNVIKSFHLDLMELFASTIASRAEAGRK